MLKCAPYIKNLCHHINSHVQSDGDVSSNQIPFHSLAKVRESEVKISDLKGFKVELIESKLANPLVIIGGDFIVSAKPDLFKAIKKIRPDSPDVIRAAKRFEQACLKRKCSSVQVLETFEENTCEAEVQDKLFDVIDNGER